MRKRIYLSFFLSGFAALTYQILWKRELALIFGSSIYAITAVVASFMLGLGIGSIFLGRKADRIENPLKWYFFIQISIGVLALILNLVFPFLNEIFSELARNTQSLPIQLSIKFALSIITLFLPTFLMGGTFPILSRFMLRNKKEEGREIGSLYAVNTLGSVTGGFITGFFLIRFLGTNLTCGMGFLFNILAAVLIYNLQTEKVSTVKESFSPAGLKSVFPLVAFFTGLTGLGYEILWNRILSIYVANTTYSFTSILIVFLSGLTIGAWIYAKKLSVKRNKYVIFASAQFILAFYILIIETSVQSLPGVLILFENILFIPQVRVFLPVFILSVILFLPPTIMMGITFPLLCTLEAEKTENKGEAVGIVYLFNTLGSVIGTILAGFILISILGTHRSISLLAVINIILGITFIRFWRRKKIALVISVLLLLFGGWNLIFTEKMILPPSFYRIKERQDRVLFYRENPTGNVVVVEDVKTGIRSCYVNNSMVVGTTYDALKAVKLLGHLPMLFHGNPVEILVIGFGTGITTSSVTLYPEVEKVDCIEIARGLKDASRLFTSYNRNVISNPLINYKVKDGRNFLLQSEKKYDVITCDPTHPALGSGNLYTREFYILMKEHLREKGLVAQYFPLHKLGKEELKILIRTFHSVFPQTSIWIAGAHGVLLGGVKDYSRTKNEVQNKLSMRKISMDLKNIYSNSLYKLLKTFFMDSIHISKYTGRGIKNTDDRPLLEFISPYSVDYESWAHNLKEMLEYRAEPHSLFKDSLNSDSLELYFNSSNYFYRALTMKGLGKIEETTGELKKALSMNPTDKEFRMYLNQELLYLKHLKN